MKFGKQFLNKIKKTHSRKEKILIKLPVSVKQQWFSNSLFIGLFAQVKIFEDLQRVVYVLHLSAYTIAENKTKKKFSL